ncbi:MAG: hypothetical protein ACRD2H_06215 [Terriglobales bacterium]
MSSTVRRVIASAAPVPAHRVGRDSRMCTMVEIGVHPRVMQGRAGHATSKLTMELYAHVPESADRQAAESLDRHYRQQADDERRPA